MHSILRHQATRRLFLLGVGELVLMVGAMIVARSLRYFEATEQIAQVSNHEFARSVVFALFLLLGMTALGFYRPNVRTRWLNQVARQLTAFALGGLGLVVSYYFIPEARVGRGVLAIALILGFSAVLIFRMLFMRVLEIETLKQRILVIGSGQRAADIHKQMRQRSDSDGFSIVAYIAFPNEEIGVPSSLVMHLDMSLMALVKRERVSEIVVAVDDRRNRLPMEDLLECRIAGVNVTDLTTFFEREFGCLQLSGLDRSWLVFSEGFNSRWVHQLSKRSFDLLTASLLLLLSWPLMLLTILAIRLEAGRGQPLLYRQERVGEHGVTFQLLKFRSMRTDAEREGIAIWSTKNDDRVTRVGQIMRKMHLDELPQLWNIFRGEMSMVGPRPERPQFVADLAVKIPYYTLRNCLKPGLAGWAQLSYPYGASDEDAAEKLKYDLFYLKNHNLMLDIRILIETFEIVLYGNRFGRDSGQIELKIVTKDA